MVVGVDGGGTSTRAVVAERNGRIVGFEEGGGANPQHNDRDRARETVRTAVEAALADAGRDAADVAALTAGFAGLNDESDQEWARSFVDLRNLGCEPVCVNDAVVARIGALEGDPGIVAIGGTGCIVFGVTADGRHVRNYDLVHYARSAARHVTGRAVHEILISEPDPAESPLVARLFDHWDVDSVAELRAAIRENEWFSTDESGNAFDSAAPLVTAAAAEGDPIAKNACDDRVAEVVTGVRALASYFDAAPVAVAPTGGVLGSEYMSRRVRERLGDAAESYRVVRPALSPVAGAAYAGLERLGDEITDEVVDRLRAHPAGEP